ncbi:unnamed protein product [Protopolystoma xenopodis]|uniref:Uncharacterized protein n=1 Tax=Protopolystoma xenopodis TaxID=117903 RepID=A0A3S5B5V4_9PLAT|nr:unnamed protein product [Protopolystoma xenopodis]
MILPPKDRTSHLHIDSLESLSSGPFGATRLALLDVSALEIGCQPAAGHACAKNMDPPRDLRAPSCGGSSCAPHSHSLFVCPSLVGLTRDSCKMHSCREGISPTHL